MKEESPGSGLPCWSESFKIKLVIHEGEAGTADQELNRWICLLEKLFTGQLLMLIGATISPMYVFRAGGFPLELWMLQRNLTSLGVLVRANLKGYPGHFSIGVLQQLLGSPFNTGGLQCALVCRALNPHFCTDILTCPKKQGLLPVTTALVWARPACGAFPFYVLLAARLTLLWFCWELCTWLCLQIWPLAAWSPISLTAREIMQNIQKDAVVCNE